jgi:hypothetical protein
MPRFKTDLITIHGAATAVTVRSGVQCSSNQLLPTRLPCIHVEPEGDTTNEYRSASN